VRVFLDANILFSAAKADGVVRQLVRLVTDAGRECWIDAWVEAEARRNLTAKYPEALAGLDELLEGCRLAPLLPLTAELDAALDFLPADDRPVLAAAIRIGCEALITGDKTHFGPIYGKKVRGVAICSPAGFFAEVFRSGK